MGLVRIFILSIMAALFTSGTAVADVKTTKAKRGLEEMLRDMEGRIAKNCGIQVKASVNYAPIESYDYASLGRTKDNVVGTMEMVLESYLRRYMDLCDDADYKAAMSPYPNLVFTPATNPDSSVSKSVNKAELSGSGINVTFAPLTNDDMYVFEPLF